MIEGNQAVQAKESQTHKIVAFRSPIQNPGPEHQGSKFERLRTGAGAVSLVTFISVMVFCMPAAFYAGHASGVSSSGCDTRQARPFSGRLLSSGGNGRQLSHDIKAERHVDAGERHIHSLEPMDTGKLLQGCPLPLPPPDPTPTSRCSP